MALTNFTTIKAVIADYLDRSDLADQITDFMSLAENQIYRDLRVSAMETSLSATISSGTISVPSGYIEMKNLFLNTSPVTPLVRKDLNFIYTNHPTRSADARPSFFAREGTNFIFGPFPDSNYAVLGLFYKRLDALTGTNTNFITTDIPEALIFGSCLEAEPFLQNDERIAVWKTKYDEVINDYQAKDTAEALSGSPLTVTAG
mgnify:CR=1 FL=1|tara:strand:+ start:258 stop:866 length:609 start_codon:yes stop_codon:yes gene_type:complete